MELPFGRRVMCGNFYVLKHMKALDKKTLKSLRSAQGIPADVQKYLKRGTLPYITVGTVSDSWRIEFAVGLTMYKAIDEIPVAVDNEGVCTYWGNARVNLGNLINGWFAYTSTAGDTEYQASVIKALQDYLARMSEKNAEPLSEEETVRVLEEIEKQEQSRDALLSGYDKKAEP